MAVTRSKKEDILSKLKEDFEKATAVYFANYCGLSVKELSELRGKVRETNAKISVAKKTLIKMAAETAGYKEIPEESMEGPVAAVFAFEDQASPAKAVYTFLKDFEELALVGALMDGNVLSKAEAQELAQLPSRDELLAKLVGSMNAPISGFHGVLHGVMREFVGVVSALKDKKEEDGDSPAPAETTKEENTPVAAEAKPEETKEESKPDEKKEEAKTDTSAEDETK